MTTAGATHDRMMREKTTTAAAAALARWCCLSSQRTRRDALAAQRSALSEMQTGEAKALHTRSLKAGLDVSDPALGEAFKRLATGASGVGWVLYGYDAANPAKCVVAGTGSGAAELLAALRDDQIFFGALRVSVGGGGSGGARLLSFLWIGPSVSPIKRGKAALHQNAVRDGAMEGGSMLRGQVSLWDEGKEAVVSVAELEARVRAALGIGAGDGQAVTIAS